MPATNFAKTIIVDSGYWYALYSPRDQYHSEAQEKESFLQTRNVLIPWPSLYETVNSRFVKNRIALWNFETFLRLPHVIRLSDDQYREAALEASLEMALIRARNIALVDMVIRLILEDTNVRKHGLLTFNPADFTDVCWQHQIEML